MAGPPHGHRHGLRGRAADERPRTRESAMPARGETERIVDHRRSRLHPSRQRRLRQPHLLRREATSDGRRRDLPALLLRRQRPSFRRTELQPGPGDSPSRKSPRLPWPRLRRRPAAVRGGGKNRRPRPPPHRLRDARAGRDGPGPRLRRRRARGCRRRPRFDTATTTKCPPPRVPRPQCDALQLPPSSMHLVTLLRGEKKSLLRRSGLLGASGTSEGLLVVRWGLRQGHDRRGADDAQDEGVGLRHLDHVVAFLWVRLSRTN
mmetsp:Transcript_16415/g.53439  ORF Transcript_16415/g.53439 Transcript_16415/m.53439 type:complete len:262 (+) Transcript_16415:1048-1833(+)